MQEIFTHLPNHITVLWKIFINSYFNLKVLIYLTEHGNQTWQSFSKRKDYKITLTSLFGKLQEHKLELGQLEQHEEIEKRHKNIFLNAE